MLTHMEFRKDEECFKARLLIKPISQCRERIKVVMEYYLRYDLSHEKITLY